MTTHPCGCVTAPHAPSGVTRSVSKCARHRAQMRDPATLDGAYYEELGVLKGGEPAETAHVAELAEALGEFPVVTDWAGEALEVGCGASPYVRAIADAGYRYLGLDPSPWAAGWVRDTYGVKTLAIPVESLWNGIDLFLNQNRWRLILAAHVLEHLDDAPGVIFGLGKSLAPGGELWVVAPDDSDMGNPDHVFFFTEATLRSCLEAAGLVVVRSAVRRYVPQENFLYCRAKKPCHS